MDMTAMRVIDWIATSAMSSPNIWGSFPLDLLHGVAYSCICDCIVRFGSDSLTLAFTFPALAGLSRYIHWKSSFPRLCGVLVQALPSV